MVLPLYPTVKLALSAYKKKTSTKTEYSKQNFCFLLSELMPLTCFLDIIGCVPDKMAPKYTSLLPFLKNLFTTSTKEDIRETAAVIYAIITVSTAEKRAIDREIKDFAAQCVSNKSLEAQVRKSS